MALALFACAFPTNAQETPFTVQFHLEENGHPVNGPIDMQFLVDLNGCPLAPPITNFAIPVIDGVGTTTIDVGALLGNGTNSLRVAIRPAGGTNPFTLLTPALPITPVPLASRAFTADHLNGVLDATNIPARSITASQIALGSEGLKSELCYLEPQWLTCGETLFP